LNVAVGSKSTLSRHPNGAVGEIGKPALVFSIHGLREINFPAQAVVERQLRSDAPSVLSVEKEPFLPLGGVSTGADVSAEAGDVAEQQGSQTQAARTGVRSPQLVEGQLPGAIGIAGNSQVPGFTNIGAEFVLVVAYDLGPVVDELDLVLAFGQGAVAAPE